MYLKYLIRLLVFQLFYKDTWKRFFLNAKDRHTDIRKLAFSNKVADKWNSLSGCTTINGFRSDISGEPEPETRT